ncbi:MAG: hypothetical protein AB1918_01600 [Pseudomonadota bacterium]
MTVMEFPLIDETTTMTSAATAALDERELVWLMVLGSVAEGPVPLATLVSRIEGMILDGGGAAVRSASACLQEMARGGHVVLSSDGRRWTVSAGPKAAATLSLLAASDPYRLSPSLKTVFDRLVRFFRG